MTTDQIVAIAMGSAILCLIVILRTDRNALSLRNRLRALLARFLPPYSPRVYELYLQESPIWKELRRKAKERDGSRCRICNHAEPQDLQVHHRHYPEIYGTETVDDLTTLCRWCHDAIHHHLSWAPKPLRYPEHRKGWARALAAYLKRQLTPN